MSNTRFLVFETGGTKLVAGVAGPDGRLLDRRVTARTAEWRAPESLASLLVLGRNLRAEHEERGARFAAIGVGFGGGVDRARKHPLPCLHEDGWEDIDVVGAFESAFNLPVALENDCKTAALGEALFGAGQGAASVLYVTLGTGVGGGLVREGRIVELSSHGEAEIGHVHVMPDGPACACGGAGCVEALTSGPGIVGLAEWLAKRDPALARQAERPFRPEGLFAAWREGDRFAEAVVEIAARGLAAGLAASVNLLAPERVVIGGGVGTGNPDYLERVEELAQPLVVPYFRERWSMLPSSLGTDAVCQGAAALARDLAAQT